MLEELYLVRHAAPNRELKLPYNILPGPPLTPLGEHEAAQAAQWLAGHAIDHLLSSPFTRARATAEAIAEALGLPLTIVDALREGGPGETMEQIQARTSELLGQIDDSPLRCVALVSHGAPLRTLLMHTTAGRIDLSRHIYDFGNNTPTAGIWHGVRNASTWQWELVFRPSAASAAPPVLV